jgi:two-component system, NtrC family, sensor kinase
MVTGGRKAGKRGQVPKRAKPAPKPQSTALRSARPKSRKPKSGERKADKPKSETARLKRFLRAAEDRQAATADILKVIASSPSDVQPVFDAIVASANRLIGGYATAVFRFIDGYGHLAAFTPINPDADEKLEAVFPQRIADVRMFRRAQAGEVLQIDATEKSDERLRDIARARGFRSVLYVPLKSKETSIGVIATNRRTPGPFSAHDVRLLQTFADQAVIAIENVRLFNETQEALERQTATADILKVIASSPDNVQPVFDAIAQSAKRLFGAHTAVVTRVIGDMIHLAAFTSDNEAGNEVLQRSFPFPLSTPDIHTRVVRSGAIEFRTDVLSEPNVPPGAKIVARARGYRSILVVPMLREGNAIGTIVVTRPDPGPFSKNEIELLQTFADQAAIAIGNVQLFDAVQARTRELSQSLEDLRAAQDRLVQTEKLASLGQLTAGIAHEIKNPLNFVNNFSALSVELTDELKDVLKHAELGEKYRLEADELTGMLQDNLSKVIQHGKRADSIVKNMLLHSREGSGEQRPTDVNALVEESLNLAYHGARAEKSGFEINLQRDFDANVGTIVLFPQEISRALLNLISNGFYAATKRKAENGGAGVKPTVLATTKNLGSSVEIRIRDNGAGISPEVREKMFNPFFTTKPTGEGTGLGLSMTHDIIVKQHGGRIDVETKLGEFTEFIITLPRRATAGMTDCGPKRT